MKDSVRATTFQKCSYLCTFAFSLYTVNRKYFIPITFQRCFVCYAQTSLQSLSKCLTIYFYFHSFFQDQENASGAVGLRGRLLVHVQHRRQRGRRLSTDPTVQVDRHVAGPDAARTTNPGEGVESADSATTAPSRGSRYS